MIRICTHMLQAVVAVPQDGKRLNWYEENSIDAPRYLQDLVNNETGMLKKLNKKPNAVPEVLCGMWVLVLPARLCCMYFSNQENQQTCGNDTAGTRGVWRILSTSDQHGEIMRFGRFTLESLGRITQ